MHANSRSLGITLLKATTQRHTISSESALNQKRKGTSRRPIRFSSENSKAPRRWRGDRTSPAARSRSSPRPPTHLLMKTTKKRCVSAGAGEGGRECAWEAPVVDTQELSWVSRVICSRDLADGRMCGPRYHRKRPSRATSQTTTRRASLVAARRMRLKNKSQRNVTMKVRKYALGELEIDGVGTCGAHALSDPCDKCLPFCKSRSR